MYDLPRARAFSPSPQQIQPGIQPLIKIAMPVRKLIGNNSVNAFTPLPNSPFILDLWFNVADRAGVRYVRVLAQDAHEVC